MIGIVVFMANHEPQTFFLDLYDLDLNQISGDIVLPDFKETTHRLYTQGDYLYMLRQSESADTERAKNPQVMVYSLKHDLDLKRNNE